MMTDLPIFTADMSWATQGACADKPREWFYPGDTHSSGYALARDVCRTCPVLDKCQAHGIEYETHGMWGGLSERQRARVRRGQPIPDVLTEPEPTPTPVAKPPKKRRKPQRGPMGRPRQLTPEQIQRVRDAEGTHGEIAETFGVSRRTVYSIRSGEGRYGDLSTDCGPCGPQAASDTLGENPEKPRQCANTPGHGPALQGDCS